MMRQQSLRSIMQAQISNINLDKINSNILSTRKENNVIFCALIKNAPKTETHYPLWSLVWSALESE